MKLMWHIMVKDLRAERWALLVWSALFAGQAALGFAVSGLDVDSGLIDNLKIGNSLLVGLQFATAYVLVVQLVQADPIAGTRMFWLTRPIRPGRLLGAKAATALMVFALLPALLLLPWWLYNGFTARDVAWSAVELLGWQLLVIAPAFVIASLTDDLGRAILWGLVLLAALVAGVVILRSNVANGVRLAADLISGDFNRHGGLLFTKLWLGGFLLVAVSTALATHQFLTRRVVRCLVIAVPALAVMLVAARFWPWDCAILFTQLNDPEPAAEIAEASLAGVQVSLPLPEIQGPVESGYKTPHTWVEQTMELRGLPDDLTIARTRVFQTVQWPTEGGLSLRQWQLFSWTEPSLRKALALPPPREDPETARWLDVHYAERRSRGLPVWPGFAAWKADGDRMLLVGRSSLQNSLVARIRSQPPQGEARVEIELARPAVRLQMPLATGSHWSGGSLGYRVGEINPSAGGNATFQLQTASPAVRKNGIWLADAMDSPRRRNDDYYRDFLVVNRHDSSIGWTGGSGDMAKSGRAVIGGVNLDWRAVRVHPTRVIRNGQWVPSDPDWRQHAELLLVDISPARRFVRKLKTDKYEFRGHLPENAVPSKPSDRI